jgi:hypothetical protein
VAHKAENVRVVNPILAWVKTHGGDGFKVHGSMFQRKGEPDLDGWLPHLTRPGEYVHFKVEAKFGKGRADPLQLQRLAVYAGAGYMTGVVYSLEEFIELYRRWCGQNDNGNKSV